ncbi:RNA methyltransferase [Candidatus Bathyarchaeota archaeon]|jgi:predicted SPOUT superfamily RNA methylase MTH1|nr:RNA methyltransferase [Candidatus Bathyarchaeota archaeon]
MSWAPRRKKRLSVAIPSSFVSDIPHLREKTVRVGLLARAAAIFRVDEILIYRSTAQADSKEARFLKTILSYLETPQYLRKRVFPLSQDMQYVGVLPPLRTPHHPISKASENGSTAYREGIVVASEKNWAIVEVGLADEVRLEGSSLRKATRVTVRIEKTGQGERFSVVSREEVPFYWGYNVSVSERALGETLKRRSDELIILTSRYGDPLLQRMEDLKRELSEASRILVVFGSPQEGIAEILSRERLKPLDFTDIILNMFPNQGTVTVRTEEAVYATLGILNVLEPMQE